MSFLIVSVFFPWKTDGKLLVLPFQLQVSAIWLLLHFPYGLCADAALAFVIGVCLWTAKKLLKKGGQTKEGNPSLCLPPIPNTVTS